MLGYDDLKKLADRIKNGEPSKLVKPRKTGDITITTDYGVYEVLKDGSTKKL